MQEKEEITEYGKIPEFEIYPNLRKYINERNFSIFSDLHSNHIDILLILNEIEENKKFNKEIFLEVISFLSDVLILKKEDFSMEFDEKSVSIFIKMFPFLLTEIDRKFLKMVKRISPSLTLILFIKILKTDIKDIETFTLYIENEIEKYFDYEKNMNVLNTENDDIRKIDIWNEQIISNYQKDIDKYIEIYKEGEKDFNRINDLTK